MDEDSQINQKLYEYQQKREGESVCPTNFDYSQCTDDEWIARLLSDPIIKELFEKLKKENEELIGLQVENQKLTNMLHELSGTAEEITLGDFLGPKSLGQRPVQSQPPVQPESGFWSRLFKGGGWDMEKLNQLPTQTGCPVYTRKLNFNKCEMNTIVDFLLKDPRILKYLMKNRMEEYNALIKNRELNTVDLKDENYRLKFNINRAHRVAGTTSPLKLNWKMSYAEGGKMRRRLTHRLVRKSRLTHRRLVRKSRLTHRRLVRKSHKSRR